MNISMKIFVIIIEFILAVAMSTCITMMMSVLLGTQVVYWLSFVIGLVMGRVLGNRWSKLLFED